MERRAFLKGLAALAVCPLCATRGLAAAGGHWSYEGKDGPAHWGALSKENAACSVGSQQSPVNIVAATKAELPSLKPAWQKAADKIINNGHTIQVTMPRGSMLSAGAANYELVQFHFHAPSEHQVDGKAFPMEVHFVHDKVGTKDAGALAIFLTAGKPNASFAAIAGAFPATGKDAPGPAGADPSGLLPAVLKYWRYEGSLTTPPCGENVDWMVLMEPVEVAAADIAKFTALYPMNARPILPTNRRFILSSE
jgi:carbonic anhydrase